MRGADQSVAKSCAPICPSSSSCAGIAAAFAERAEHRPVIGGQQDTAPHRGEARIAEPGKVAPVVPPSPMSNSRSFSALVWEGLLWGISVRP